MQIQQLQITYSQAEDRLILRINGSKDEEIRLFLSRRFVVEFTDILNKVIDYPHPIKTASDAAIKQEIKTQTLINPTDYNTYFDETAKFPIGESPVLIIGANISKNADGGTTITFSSAGDKNINLNLNQQLILSLADLLKQIIPTTGWDLRGFSSVQVIKNQGQPVLH